MRILFLVENPQEGGVTSFTEAFKQTQKNELYDFFYFKSTGKDLNQIQKLFLLILDVFKFGFILFTKKIDIIFLNTSLLKNSIRRDGLYALIAHYSGHKIYVHWHGWNKDNEYLLNNFFCRYGLFRAKHIRVLSSDFKHKLKEKGFDNLITVGNTMVGYELLESSNLSNNRKSDQINLLYLATVSKNKGIYETITIFHRLQKKYSNLFLSIAGNGPELDQIMNNIEKNHWSNIRCLGYLKGNQKKEVFRASDIYIFPSYYEGMPISVLEAMYFGLPVICSAVGGLKDFFISGKMGYMVNNPSDIDSFVSYIEILLNNESLRIEISDYNKAFANLKFLPSYTVKQIEQEINNI